MHPSSHLPGVLRNPALAPHAISDRPAWLFDATGGRLVFANAAAAALTLPAELRERVARMAETLPADGAPRLERLRHLGDGIGQTITCACARVAHENEPAILVAALEPVGPALTLAERLQPLLQGEAAAAFDTQGALIHATPEADLPASGTGIQAFKDSAELIPIGDVTLAFARPSVDLGPIAQAMAQMSQPQTPPLAAQTNGRRHPLRFNWQTDAGNRFSITSDEFLALAGPRTVNLLGRFWGEVSAKLALDPEGEVAHALNSRDTWSGLAVRWPMADGERITVVLSGIPTFDRERGFQGYHGFGVWREEGPGAAEPAPLPENLPLVSATPAPEAAPAPPPQDNDISATDETTPKDETPADKTPEDTRAAENVVPFRTAHQDGRAATLNPVERNAFREIGSRLAARLKGADEVARGLVERPGDEPLSGGMAQSTPPAEPDAPSFSHALLDPLPMGVLVYRGASPLYANAEFLRFTGHASLSDFTQAGGLDSLFIETEDGSGTETGQALRVAASEHGAARPGRLSSLMIDGEKALMLALSGSDDAAAEPVDGSSDALAAIVDIAADGVVILDRDGRILEANPAAIRLFDESDLSGRPFANLFDADSERTALGELTRALTAPAGSASKAGRDVVARRHGAPLHLNIVVARIDGTGERLCAVFRDITRWKNAERELTAARQQAEKASSAKSEFLARISHEMRTPLNAIIGFSEVMMAERFGPVGNERYRDYLKDIAGSGAHLVSLLNDLLDLSKIEAGKMELAFEPVNLNTLTQQSVALVQPQANDARVIIRTALSMNVPQISADARSVRQIVLNLLSNSIKFTGAGGQVIVSTAATEGGEVMLRVRDTGVGMSEKDIEAALQPFRQLATAPRTAAGGTGLGLPLTKALVEANHARFAIKSAVDAGTLVEILFPAMRDAAE
jgi:PAS domain S-box-containing protein